MNVETKLEPCPRERIETKHLRCNGMTPTQWELAAVGQHAPAFADWPEVVEFAAAIIKADAEWREQNAPTFESLRAKYPDVVFSLGLEYGTDWLWRAVVNKPHGDGINWPFRAQADALEWLAAKLAETEGKTDGT